jgi:phosphatidylserine/phosphatidylglycerophosphate/cardiolipin synthase-like enzyme
MSVIVAPRPILFQCMRAAMLVFAVLALRSSTSAFGVQSPPRAATTPSRALLEPGAGVRPLTRLIDRAQDHIFVEAYILTDARIEHALERAAAQGVKVYVLLERHPFGLETLPPRTAAQLRAAGIFLRWSSPRFRYTHAKLMVLDDRVAIISTANFSRAGFSADRDIVLFDTDSVDVRAASEIFRADWNGVDPSFADPRLVVAPTSARRQLMELCSRATRSLDIYSEELNDPGVERLLWSRAGRGVRVHVLLPAGTRTAALAGLRHRVGIRTLANPYIHAKVIVADGRLAFVGSENLSSTSLDRNREVGLFIRGKTVAELSKVFARDWKLAAK